MYILQLWLNSWGFAVKTNVILYNVQITAYHHFGGEPRNNISVSQLKPVFQILVNYDQRLQITSEKLSLMNQFGTSFHR